MLAAVIAGLPASTPPPTPAPVVRQLLLPRACAAPIPSGYQMHCHWLSLETGGALAAVRLVPAAGAQRPPLIYLAGGPGQGGNTSPDSIATWAAWARAAAPDRSLILVDLRHTPGARGARDCHAYTQASRQLLGQALDPVDESRALAPIMRACLAELSAVMPLHTFASTRYASDLQALQRAYGDPAWAILGVSYGTRLALASVPLLAVERLVLDSPYPPGHGGAAAEVERLRQAFSDWWAACDAGIDCPAGQRDSEALFWQAFATLQRSPQTLSVGDWNNGGRARVAVNGARLILAGYSALYQASTRLQLLALIRAAAAGEPLPLAPFEQLYNVSFDPSFNAMTYWLTECSDNPAAALPELDSLDRWGDFFRGDAEFDLCAEAGLGATPLAAGPPLLVPSLIAVGDRDPITPPSYADSLATTAGGYRVLGRGLGHAEYVFSDCGIAQIRQWLQHQVPTDCGHWTVQPQRTIDP